MFTMSEALSLSTVRWQPRTGRMTTVSTWSRGGGPAPGPPHWAGGWGRGAGGGRPVGVVCVRAAVGGGDAVGGPPPWDVVLGAGVSGLVDGDAEGVLYGGCLSILVASLGTPYEIKTANTILFVEDLAAKPYQIDRMLMQLKLAGHFDAVRGIVFGEMLDCVQTANQAYTLQDVVSRIVGDLGVPVAFGVRSGHVTSGNITLPFGVRAKLAVRRGQVALRILESSVKP